MTKEELEKATGQELIDARNYCGVDGYYGDYLDNVNAEMLKRFNRLADLEKENAKLKDGIALKDEEIGCIETYFNTFKSKAKELLKQWLQTSKASGCDNINIVTDTEQFLSEVENDR